MNQLVGERLRRLGLDVEFLAWLEGPGERLPDPDRVRKIQGEEFAAALRAVAWLSQHFSEPELISPHTPKEWLARYDLLQHFLRAALSWSMVYHATSVSEDLETLERVLGELLPSSSWDRYRQDIWHLRKHGQPVRLPKMPGKASGGKGQSEQTMRMRAAVKYVSSVSKTPYADLAALWNERQTAVVYHPDEIRDRLRKGHPLSKGPGATKRLLEFWREVYQGNWTAVFPGPFPPSRELAELLRR